MAMPTWDQWRVLVVDSDTQFLSMAEQSLRGVNIADVQITESAAKALELVGQFSIDLVLLDTEPVGMSGLELTRILRDEDKSSRPDVFVVLTAESVDANLLRKACEAGIESFIRKPIEADVLIKRIANVITNPRRFVVSKTYFGPDRRKQHLKPYGGIERRRSVLRETHEARARERRAAAMKIRELHDCTNRKPRSDYDVEPPDEADPEEQEEKKVIPATSTASSAIAKPPVPKPAIIPAKMESPAAPGNNTVKNDIERPNEVTSDKAAPKSAKQPSPTISRGGIEVAPAVPPDPSVSKLTPVLDEHTKWLRSRGEEGGKANFSQKDLHGEDLAKANLANANLREVILADANCREAKFQGADLRRADLSNVDFSNADLGVAIMRHANLSLARLDGASLRGADLAGGNLKGASLKQTDMAGTNLLSADMRDSDWRTTVGLTQVQINKANADSTTRLPAGLRIPVKDE